MSHVGSNDTPGTLLVPFLGPSWGPGWPRQGHPEPPCGSLGPLLGLSWPASGPFWGHLGPYWGNIWASGSFHGAMTTNMKNH